MLLICIYKKNKNPLYAYGKGNKYEYEIYELRGKKGDYQMPRRERTT
jgi:hypothetical protein